MLGYEFGEKPAGVPLTPIEWPIDPEAFSETLRTVHGATACRFTFSKTDMAISTSPTRPEL